MAMNKYDKARVAVAVLTMFFLTATIYASAQEACSLDVQECPDGSFVGRIGPNCEFASCDAELPPPPENGAPPTNGGPSTPDEIFSQKQVTGFLDFVVDGVKWVFGDLLRFALDAVLDFTASLGQAIGLSYTEIVVTLLILVLIFVTAKLRGIMDATEKLSWLIILLLVIVLAVMLGPRITEVFTNLGNVIGGSMGGGL